MGQEFGKNGKVTKVCESIPIIGYVAAAAQGIAGNQDEAKRAAAKCTNGTMTLAGGIAGGIVAGPGGAFLGAAALKGAGIATEYGIGHNHIDDAEVRAETVPTVKSAALDIALAGASSGAGAVGGTIVKEVTGTTAKELGGYFCKEGIKHTLKEVAVGKVVSVPLVDAPGAFISRK